MKWLISCLLVLVMASVVYAGEDPYIAIVGNDCPTIVSSEGSPGCVADPFYFSPKYMQFMLDQSNENLAIPVCDGDPNSVVKKNNYTRFWGGADTDKGCEAFEANKPINQPEICDVLGEIGEGGFAKGDFMFSGEKNAVVTKQNAGWFKWFIRLPKKPSGELNICIQCGVLKPNTFTPFTAFNAIEECAAETGERIGTGWCTHDQVAANRNPIKNSALPQLTVKAYPGPFNPVDFDPFYLTAYKNPGAYCLDLTEIPTAGLGPDEKADKKMDNTASLQILDGSTDARILLKACMDKCVVAKIPVTGQVNYAGQPESDLEADDLIEVDLYIPIYNTVDIYCHSQSAKIMGIGESTF